MSEVVPHQTFERVSPSARASSSSSPKTMFESPLGHSRWMTPDAEFGRPLERRSYFHNSNDNNENNKKDEDVQEKKGEKEEEERSILIRSEAREAMLQAGMNAKEVEHIISGLVSGRRGISYLTPPPQYHSQSHQKIHPHQQHTIKATGTPTHHNSYNNPRRVGHHNSPRMITHHNSLNSPIIMSQHNSPRMMGHYNSPRMMSQRNSLLYSVSASPSSVRTHVDIRLSSTFSSCSPTISTPCGLFSTPSSSSLPLPLPLPFRTSSTSVGIEIMKSEGRIVHQAEQKKNTQTSYDAQKGTNIPEAEEEDKEEQNSHGHLEESGGSRLSTASSHCGNGGSTQGPPKVKFGTESENDETGIKDESSDRHQKRDAAEECKQVNKTLSHEKEKSYKISEWKQLPERSEANYNIHTSSHHNDEDLSYQANKGEIHQKRSHTTPTKSPRYPAAERGGLHEEVTTQKKEDQHAKFEINVQQPLRHRPEDKNRLENSSSKSSSSAAEIGSIRSEISSKANAYVLENKTREMKSQIRDDNVTVNSKDDSSSNSRNVSITATPCEVVDDEDNGVTLVSSKDRIRDNNATANSSNECQNVLITSSPCEVDDDEENDVVQEENRYYESKSQNLIPSCGSPIHSREIPPTSSPRSTTPKPLSSSKTPPTSLSSKPPSSSKTPPTSPPGSPTPKPATPPLRSTTLKSLSSSKTPPTSPPSSPTSKPLPGYKTPPTSSPGSPTSKPLSGYKTPPSSSPRPTTPNRLSGYKTPPSSSPRSITPKPLSGYKTPPSSSPRSTTPKPLSSYKTPPSSSPRSTTPKPLSGYKTPPSSSPRSTTPKPLSSYKTPPSSSPRSTTPKPLSGYKTPPASSLRSTTPKPPSRSTTPPASSLRSTTPKPPSRSPTPPASSARPTTPKPLSGYKTPPASSPRSTTPNPPPTLTPRSTTPSKLLPSSSVSPSSATAEEQDSGKRDILSDSLFALAVEEKERTDDEDSDSNEPQQLQPISSPPVISSANSFDEVPVKGLHDPNSFSAATAPDDGMAAQQRLPCPRCGRFFHCDRLAKHVAVCTKIQSRIKQPKYRAKQKPFVSQLPSSTKHQSSPPSVPTFSTSSSPSASSSKPLNQKRVFVASPPAATASADSQSHPNKSSQQNENHPHPPPYRRQAPPHPNLQTPQSTTTSFSSHPSSLRPSSPSRSTTAKTIDSPSKQGKPKPRIEVHPPPSPSPSYISSCSFVSCGGLNEDANTSTPSGDPSNNQTFYTPSLRPLKPTGMSEEGGGDGSGEHNHNNSSNNQNSKEEPFSLLPKPSRPQRGRTRLTRCSSRPSLTLHEPLEAVDDEKETEGKRAETQLPSELHQSTKHPRTEGSDMNISKSDDDNEEGEDDTGAVNGEEISSPTTSPPSEERYRKRGSSLNNSTLSEVARVALGER